MATRRRSEPLRYQIRNEILNLLIEEDYHPGDKIPTELELMDILNVSRSTLREGLHLLEEERLIRTKHGTGRYLVSTPMDYKFDITRFQSVTEMLADYGIQVTTRVISVREVPADSQVASNLGIEVGTPVIAIERVRYAENLPVIYSIDIIEKRRAVGEWNNEIFAGSLFEILEEQWGLYIDHSHAVIRGVLADGSKPSRAPAQSVVPWILLEQVNYTPDGEPVIYSLDYHRGDSITFHVNRYRYK